MDLWLVRKKFVHVKDEGPQKEAEFKAAAVILWEITAKFDLFWQGLNQYFCGIWPREQFYSQGS